MRDRIEKSNHLCLIDGSYCIHRFFYAMPKLTRSDGIPVGATYGFARMMIKLLSKIKAEYWAVVFDSSSWFRLKIFSQYKANRHPTPPDLSLQFSLIERMCHAFSISYVKEDGCEADDIIATYVRSARLRDWLVTIVTGDKDFMQLICEKVRVLNPFCWKLISHEDVLVRWGVPPSKVCDVQALAGDRVDNIPGVPGIGFKIASRLINHYGTFLEVLNQASNRETKILKIIDSHREIAIISYGLSKLNDSLVELQSIETFRLSNVLDHVLVESFFSEQNFSSLLRKS